MQERGRSVFSVINQYEQTVRPMYFEFIERSKGFADIIIPQGGKNLAAIDIIRSRLELHLTSIRREK
jgi:uridine kinase